MDDTKIKILILGGTGLIGNGLFNTMSANSSLEVFATSRASTPPKNLSMKLRDKLFLRVDATQGERFLNFISDVHPDVLINCIGLTKHLPSGNDPLTAIPLNSFLPHYLAAHCRATNIRFIHISSDCVFSGNRGQYLEGDVPDSNDVYGRTKALGEVCDGQSLVIRTSTIGHELSTNFGLLDWFLSQRDGCSGYKNAIFSGVTTVELARIIQEYVIPAPHLHGIYNVSGRSISKYDLLSLIAKVYEKKIHIIPDYGFSINRTLDCGKFAKATGYEPSSWSELIRKMYQSQQGTADV